MKGYCSGNRSHYSSWYIRLSSDKVLCYSRTLRAYPTRAVEQIIRRSSLSPSRLRQVSRLGTQCWILSKIVHEVPMCGWNEWWVELINYWLELLVVKIIAIISVTSIRQRAAWSSTVITNKHSLKAGNQGKPKQNGNLYEQSLTPFCTYFRINLLNCCPCSFLSPHAPLPSTLKS